MKRCSKCEEIKRESDFSKHKNGKNGLNSQCKKCLHIKRRKYIEKNVEKSHTYNQEYYRKNKDFFVNWRNITLMEYDAILKSQDGHCAVCDRITSDDGTRLCVDHDHETGKIRGLLCRHHNIVLGHVRDDIKELEMLINYLRGSI